MTLPHPTSRPFIRQRASGPFWYAKWSRDGAPVVRSLGRAWVEPDGSGRWRRRRGRAPGGTLTETEAAVRMHELIRAHDEDQRRLEADADERRRRGVTFRELAAEWIVYLEHEKGAKPSTLRDYRWLLAEPCGTRGIRALTADRCPCDRPSALGRLSRAAATPRTAVARIGICGADDVRAGNCRVSASVVWASGPSSERVGSVRLASMIGSFIRRVQ